MTKKTIAQNTGRSGRVNLSGPELKKFDAQVGDPVKIDIAESKGIAKTIIEHCTETEFVIMSKPDPDQRPTEAANE